MVDEKALVNDYNNWVSQTELKRKYKIAYSTLKKICQKYDVWIEDRLDKMNKLSGERKRQVQHNPFIDVDNPNVQYWLGMLSTDGCISDGGSIQLSLKDKEHMVKYKNFLNVDALNVRESIDKRFNKSMFMVVFTNKEVAEFLCSLGVCPRKTVSLSVNIDITWDFIRGVIDGDGCISRTSIEIHSASKCFTEQIFNFYKDKGLSPKIYLRKRKSILYKVVILRRLDVLYTIQELYKNSEYFLDRKFEKAKEMEKEIILRLSNSKPNSVKSNALLPLIEKLK